MAVASYTTDLTDFEDFETASTVTEVTGYTATSKFEDLDADNPIQGIRHASAEQRNAATGSIVSNGTGTTLAAGESFFFWQNFLQAGAVNTFALDGIVGIVGTGTGAYYRWTIGGSDFGRNPYGGWANQVCDPTITTGRTTQGTPGTSYSIVGYGCDVINAISKGSPYNLDVVRYGRGEVLVTDGDLANGYATFEGISSQNDTQTNRWGLFQFQAGSYLWKGLLSLGTATAVDFRDANRVIVIDNTLVVSSPFNRIEVNNTASNVDWDAINISSLGTVSRGQFEMIDGATLDFNTCVFTDMDTFIFNKGAGKCDLLNTTWRRCRSVTQGGATITGSTFDNTDSGATESLVSTSTTLGLVTGCSFVRTSGTVNAVAIGGLSGTVNVDWDGNVLTGYGTGVTGNGISSTAGGAIKATFTGDGTLNINVVNGATTPTVEIVTGGNTVVVNVIVAITVTISGLLGNTEVSVLQNPSPYTVSGQAPISLFNIDFVSAVTGTDIQLVTTATNVTSIGSSSTDFTTMVDGLVAGNKVRVTNRADLGRFDTFDVVSVSTNSIVVTSVASSTVTLQELLDSPGETVTVEKVNASYAFATSSGTVVDILVFRVGSLPIYILENTLDATKDIPVSQTLDRVVEV